MHALLRSCSSAALIFRASFLRDRGMDSEESMCAMYRTECTNTVFQRPWSSAFSSRCRHLTASLSILYTQTVYDCQSWMSAGTLGVQIGRHPWGKCCSLQGKRRVSWYGELCMHFYARVFPRCSHLSGNLLQNRGIDGVEGMRALANCI